MPNAKPKQGIGVLGVGVAACAACCAPPVIGFLGAAGLGTIVGVALFGVLGLLVAAALAVLYFRSRSHSRTRTSTSVPVTLGSKPDA